MEIIDLITKQGNGQTIRQFGSHFELSHQDVQALFEYAIPMMEDALTRIMASPQGLAAILAQLASTQYQQDLEASDFFSNSRILANGTGLLSLLMRNEAVIRIVSYVVAEGSNIDVKLVRRMMPFIAIHFINALAIRSHQPLRELADRCSPIAPSRGEGSTRLAELVLSNTPKQEPPTRRENRAGSIKDILNTLSRIEMDEEGERLPLH